MYPCCFSKSAREVSVPFSAIANEKIGNARVANMVAAGAIIGLTGITDAETFQTLIRQLPKKQLIEPNLKAFNEGLKSVEKIPRPATSKAG